MRKSRHKELISLLCIAIISIFGLVAIKSIDSTEEPEPYIQETTLNRAMAIVEPLVRSSMDPDKIDYKLSTQDGNSIILTINVPQSNVENATHEQWNELTELALLVSSEMYEILEDNNLNFINFGAFIGDVQQDYYFYASINGSVMLDIPNGVGIDMDEETIEKGEVI